MAYNKTFHKYENDICIEKECSNCRAIKPAQEYHKINTTKSGLRSKCIICYNAMFTALRETDQHKEKARKLLNNWRKNNRHKAEAMPSFKKYRSSAKCKNTRSNYTRKNRGRYNALNSTRNRMIEKSALSYNFKESIKVIYETAAARKKETGIEFTVDHIIPIINKNVCGLHVPWNLQIITKIENSSKRNKFDGTYENATWRSNVKTNK
jgi:hypothetical protein